MYRNANNSRILSKDANHIISNTQVLRSVDDILNQISGQVNDTLTVQNNPYLELKTSDSLKTKYQTKKVKGNKDYVRPVPQMDSKGVIHRVFQVIYGVHKPYKKHKQFSSDGFLTLNADNNFVHLYSSEGKGLGQSKGLKDTEEYHFGNRLIVGSNEVEISDEVSAQEFKSGKYFIKTDDN